MFSNLIIYDLNHLFNFLYFLFHINCNTTVDGKISDEGFDEDEKEYAQKAKWVDIEYLRKNKHACSINIKDELIDSILNRL